MFDQVTVAAAQVSQLAGKVGHSDTLWDTQQSGH